MGKAKKLLNLLACLIMGATAVGVAGCDFVPQGNSQAEQSSLMNQINGITSSVEESQSDSIKEEVHEHAWDEGRITTEAGCGTEGEKTYSCTCGETYTEKVDALEHSYTDYHSNEDATCEEDGTKTATCDNGCGTTDTITDENSALGHNFQARYCGACGSWLPSKGLRYALNDDRTSYIMEGFDTCTDTIVVIPSVYEDLPVTGIANFAFNGRTDLTDVIIPESITAVGEFAFLGCVNLTRVLIPEGVVSIGTGAFQGCTSLKKVEFPDSVITIGEWCFYECTGLESVRLSNNLTAIEGRSFYGCSNLTGVKIPGGVLSIGASAFANCTGLAAVEIPNSVTTIEEAAFFGCKGLLNVEFGSGLISIGKQAFWSCEKLSVVIIPDNVTTIGSDALNTNGVLAVYCKAESKPDGWHEDWTWTNNPIVWGYTDYVLSNNIMYGIKDNVAHVIAQPDFSLAEICIPANVSYNGATYPIKTVETAVFSFNKIVTKFVVGENVTLIKEKAFSNCGNLTTVEIPDSVLTVEKNAFYLCSSVMFYCESLSKPDGWSEQWTDINNPVVWDCKNNDVASDGYIYTVVGGLYYGLKNGEAIVTQQSPSLTEANISNSIIYKGQTYNVTEIRFNAFDNCENLTSIVIPANVTKIRTEMMSSCESLVNITVAKENTAFQSIDGNLYTKDGKTLVLYALGKTETEFVVPQGVTTIAENAFSGAKNLTSGVISDTVTSIGEFAFSSCKNLTSVVIPSSVTTIEAYAFYYCTKLTIYCEVKEKPEGWKSSWNYSKCPVVWGE